MKLEPNMCRMRSCSEGYASAKGTYTHPGRVRLAEFGPGAGECRRVVLAPCSMKV